MKSLTFNGCTTGIYIAHCFDCVFIDCHFGNMSVGIDMSSSDNTIGSVILLDSTAASIGDVITTREENSGDHTLVIQNFKRTGDVASVVRAGNQVVLSDDVSQVWVYGNAYTNGGPSTGSHQTGSLYQVAVPSSLLQNGQYAVVPPPTFSDFNSSVNDKGIASRLNCTVCHQRKERRRVPCRW